MAYPQLARFRDAPGMHPFAAHAILECQLAFQDKHAQIFRGQRRGQC
jgi:hypothetical protein